MSSVLITGASRGIGRAAALALDREGHEVIAAVRDEAAAGRLSAEASGRLRTVRLDVTDASSIRAAADAVGGRLDALVDNAGVVVGGVVEALDLELGDAARAPLTALLDDDAPADLGGSESATISREYGYRRRDWAYHYLARLLGHELAFPRDPAARDREIAALRASVE